MAPVIGSDGFSVCNELCDPESGYSSSCTRLCKGFTFVSTKFTTVHSLTEAQSSRITTPMMPVTLSGSTVTHNSSNNLVINVNHPQWVYIPIGVIAAIIVLLLLFYFRKRLLKLFARKKLCERLPHSRHEEIQLESIGKRSVEEAKSLLDQSKQTNDGDNNVSKEGEQNKLSTEETHNIERTEPKERTFQVIAHDSDCLGNGENDSDSDSETSSVESGISRLIGSTTPNGSVPINQEDGVPRNSMKKKSAIRVTTEIELR